MNNARRSEIGKIIKDLEKFEQTVDDLLESVSSVQDAEDEAFENMPESLQNGIKGNASQEAISNLELANNEIEEIKSKIESVIEYLTAAKTDSN